MGTYALTGDDVIVIDNIPAKDFADGDIGTLELPNNLFSMQTGKNGNTIFAFDESGNNATLTLKVLLSSSDDKRFNGMIPETSNFATTKLITGSVIKQVGDGEGNVSFNTYMLQGGLVHKKPSIKTNANGDISQAVVEYVFQFAKANRVIA